MVRTHIHRPFLRAIAVLSVFTAAVGPSAGDEPARPRLDAFGDPLPDGAIARMGSVRFRHAGLSDFTWLPDGKSVATIGQDGTVRVWEAETGRQLKRVALQEAASNLFAISADGKIATGCTNEAIRVWEADSGKVLATLAGPKGYPSQLSLSPDNKLLSVGSDNRFSVWDWRSGKSQAIPIPLPQFGGHDSTFHCHFSPDGKFFVAGVQSQIPLAVFDTKKWGQVHQFDAHAATSVFTPDSKRLIVSSLTNDNGGREAVIRVFDVGSGKELQRFPTGSENVYFSLAVSPNGKVLACGASDKSCLFDLTTGKVLHQLTGRPWGLAFSPDGKTFAASAGGTYMRFWDVATGRERHEQPGTFGSNLATAVSPEGRLLAGGAWMDREVHVWDTQTGKLAGRFPLKGEGRYARSLTFSVDGRTLTAGIYSGMVQSWELATGKEVRSFQLDRDQRRVNAPSPFYYAVQMSADGRRVATIERTYRAREQSIQLTVWDAATGKAIRERSLPGMWRRGAWSADGETLAIGLNAGVALIDLDTTDERVRLESSAPVPIAMSADGRLVACVRGNAKNEVPTVGVYEVATGKAVATISARGEFGIARDNRTLFSADATHIRAWDLATGKELARRSLPEIWIGNQGQATVTELIPLAGRLAFTPVADGTGLVWDFAPPATADQKVDEKQITSWWADLRSDDPAKAYAAVWKLSEQTPDRVVAFLHRHLRPESPPDPTKLRQLIADLNSDTYRVREKATKDLENLGHAAIPALRNALAAEPPAETRRRIDQLLARKPIVADRPEQLRRLRAMQVLERGGTKEARSVLAELADGLPLAAETREARAALGRLGEPSR
jgi:WD40 repeat protein